MNMLIGNCGLGILLVFLPWDVTGFAVKLPMIYTQKGILKESSIPLFASSVSTSRSRSASNLQDWTRVGGTASESGLKLGGVSIQESLLGGLGLIISSSTSSIPTNTILVSIPTSMAITVDSASGPDDASLTDLAINNRKELRKLPWFVQFSVYLQALDKISSKREVSTKGTSVLPMEPWLDSLPRSFDTPIHWSPSDLESLHYSHMVDSVSRQQSEWKALYSTVEQISKPSLKLTYTDFVWGCECARSRAFSGSYTGSAFRPEIYAFTLLLVVIYAGLGFGSLEQAANGAGLVFCASIFKDFILPKLFQSKKYVICPIIDMANHNSLQATAEVSFEYFADAYTLATTSAINKGSEVLISYGTRSNDQLLQYYGFVESNNPHDVYIMPPLGEWNIAALEDACGVSAFEPGRLERLNRAGLLGLVGVPSASDDEDNRANPRGGVVVTRSAGLDPAVWQALRALVATADEWEAAGEAIGNFSELMSPSNELQARKAALRALQLELASKPTTLEQDVELWKRRSSKSMDKYETLALEFRIEKKKLLHEVMSDLVSQIDA
jgi:Rubisco LSMT substrate-binding/SET domain